MKFLQRLWADVRKGENLSFPVTFVTAVVLIFLTLMRVIPDTWLAPLTLAVLAEISLSLLGNRYRIETLAEQLTSRNPIVSTQFPDSLLLHEIDKAKQLMLIGVDLNSVLKKNYARLEGKLRKGHRIRIVLVNPESPACEMAAVLHYDPMTCEEKKGFINRSIKNLLELKQKTNGKLEIRLVNHLPTFGAFVTDVNTSDGAIFIWHYAFKAGDTDRLKLILRHVDGALYEKFKVEINTIWENAVPVPARTGR